MTDQRCGTCARGFYRTDNGMVSCSARVDEDAILGRGGINPIWAERKYNIGRIGGLAAALARAQKGLPPNQEADAKVAVAPEGSDFENMPPNDGAACKMWKAHPELGGDDECWHEATVVGSPYQEQISDSGKRRHRPLSLRIGGIRQDMLAQDEDMGDWRPGATPDGGAKP